MRGIKVNCADPVSSLLSRELGLEGGLMRRERMGGISYAIRS